MRRSKNRWLRRQLFLVKFVHTLLDVLAQHEVDEGLLLVGELRCCRSMGRRRPLDPRRGLNGEGHVGQHIEQVAVLGLDVALHHLVIRRVDVVVQRGGDLLDFERSQEAVVDAFLERIHEHGIAKVGVGVGVVGALRRGGQAKLHGGREVVEDRAPGAFIVGAAAVALVDDDEVEEVGRVLTKVRGPARAAHEGLKDGEEDAPVLWHLALLANVGRVNAYQRIFRKRRE